jgi:hypothetical protein
MDKGQTHKRDGAMNGPKSAGSTQQPTCKTCPSVADLPFVGGHLQPTKSPVTKQELRGQLCPKWTNNINADQPTTAEKSEARPGAKPSRTATKKERPVRVDIRTDPSVGQNKKRRRIAMAR